MVFFCAASLSLPYKDEIEGSDQDISIFDLSTHVSFGYIARIPVGSLMGIYFKAGLSYGFTGARDFYMESNAGYYTEYITRSYSRREAIGVAGLGYYCYFNSDWTLGIHIGVNINYTFNAHYKMSMRTSNWKNPEKTYLSSLKTVSEYYDNYRMTGTAIEPYIAFSFDY